ncbi:MAG: hypothetical protein ACYTF1_26120 [Planctomycetota bacterium]|jgi:ABC-type dipeptide/oligopeptide/nickel transport system ATPase subunit
MPVETLFISGPSGGGKSTVARLISTQVLEQPGHYLRMRPAKDGHTNAIVAVDPCSEDAIGKYWSSRHEVIYTADRVFEILPDGLRAVRALDKYGFAVIEADGDPALRHAYPYHYRVFVMPAPVEVHDVFRTPDDAASALQQVMQDTASFASEIFGLFDAGALDDGAGVSHQKTRQFTPAGQMVEELTISETQMRQFADSPIGAEIASRIQLQPDYHALVESDIVVINIGREGKTNALRICIGRLRKLLAQVQHQARRRSVFYWGDVTDDHDPAQAKLIRRFRRLFSK